jgi:hypothetical protein
LTQEYTQESLREEVVRVRNHHERKFNHLTDNFYVMRSALRYFSVKQGLSFTSSKISDNFPVPVTVAGSCLTVLDELDVVDPRTRSSAPDRYVPQDVDMDRMREIKEVLLENYEIQEF